MAGLGARAGPPLGGIPQPLSGMPTVVLVEHSVFDLPVASDGSADIVVEGLYARPYRCHTVFLHI